MAFESLSAKLQAVIKKMRGQTRVTEKDVKEFMREIRMAFLEADVNYKVAKNFIAEVSEKAQRLLSGKLLAYYEEDPFTLSENSLPSALTRKYRGWNSFSFARDAAYESVESYLARGGRLK